MRTVSQDKYFLRDLHREIDLFDRKLIHMVKHEEFASETLRNAAMKKLATKREALAATARTLAASGIEFHESELPRSFRPEGSSAPATAQDNTEASAEQVAVATLEPAASDFGARVMQMQRQALREEESPLASALGSWQDDLAAYKRRRQKNAVLSPAV